MDKFGNILGTTLTVIDIRYIALQSGISAACIAFIPGVGWIVAVGANLLLDYIAEDTGFVDNIKSWSSQYENEIRVILFGKGILLGR